MSNQPFNKEWEDMQQIWEQSNPAVPAVAEVLRYVSDKAAAFDRKVKRRNIRESLGAAVGLVCAVELGMRVDSVVEITFAASMAILVAGVAIQLWLRGGRPGPVDASLSRADYRNAMERKFLNQIALLRAVTFWFAVPVVAIGAATVWAYLAGEPIVTGLFFFGLMLVGSAVAWWANCVAGRRKIEQEWEKVRSALEDGQIR